MIDISECKKDFIEHYTKLITRPGADKLLDYLENKSNFFTDPASTVFHLNQPGGLVKHSLNVYYRLKWLCSEEKMRNPRFIMPSPESIAIVGLLHDLCKADTYIKSPKNFKNYDAAAIDVAPVNQIKNDAVGKFVWDTKMEYKKEENFYYGHGEKSVFIIMNFMKLTEDEAQAIRFHMASWNSEEANYAGRCFELNEFAMLAHMADEFATFVDEV